MGNTGGARGRPYRVEFQYGWNTGSVLWLTSRAAAILPAWYAAGQGDRRAGWCLR